MVDKVINICFILLGLLFLTKSYPLLSRGLGSNSISPGFFPFVLSILLLIVSLISLFFKSSVYEKVDIKRLLIFIVAIISFVVLSSFTSFFIFIPVLVAVLMKFFNIWKIKSYIIFAVAFTGFIYLLFSVLLKVNL